MSLRMRHIEGFRAVMQAGTATGAASLLNVTQPAVSQLMTDMESIVGFKLFDRRGGRLAPTANAERLFQEVERCFTGLQHITSFCDQMGQQDGDALVIASIPSIALSLLPQSIGRYLATVKRDFFTLHTRHTNDAIQLVGSQKADIGFGSKSINIPGIHCEKISSHELICVLPISHPLTKKGVITPSDLRGERFVRLAHDEGVGEDSLKLLKLNNVDILVVGSCPMSTAACALVENNVGLSLVEHGAASFFINRKVALRRFTPAIKNNFYAYWLETDSPRYRRTDFVKIMKEEALKMERDLELHLNA